MGKKPYSRALGEAVPEDVNNRPQNLLHPCMLGSVLPVICELFAVNEVLFSFSV